ncbi:hypothetical protein KNJ79_09590 [Sphingopyxis indica]|uniref:hypothetical protein n=1 Tax=Sphingopyxis indica TaxID=436663 RepID=UPI0029392A8C|nr:hypothetical protein [Sphingopyxis indica]WOF45097.1 hypothetical protein KNJ79_09590 [Sphingopyxis indica]
MALSDVITPKTIYSYAEACVQVARTSLRLGREGYRYAIIPSRGAAPIEQAANSYFHAVVKAATRGRHHRQLMSQYLTSPLSAELYLPFTADSCDEMEDISSRQVRTFWAKVLAAIIRGDLEDPHYRFFAFTRDNICRVGFKVGHEDNVRSQKFVFLDTVVSGRAITEIIDAFEAEGLTQCHYILVVDLQGEKLERPYRLKLEQLQRGGRATLLFVDTLFTEDQGPAVSGIWCLSCPELMTVARNEISAFGDHGSIGAGVYYHEVRARADNSNVSVTVGIAKLYHLLWTAVQIVASPEELLDDLHQLEMLDEAYDPDWQLLRPKLYGRQFDLDVELYLDHIDQHTLFDKGTTHRIASPKLLDAAVAKPRIEVSSSHALRMHFSRDEAAQLVRQFRDTLPA